MIIRYNRYKIKIKAKEEISLPSYKGSTFRGAFGVAFRRVVCALRKDSCEGCLLNKRCVYAYIFESRPEEKVHIFGRVSAIPRPYIIEPPVEKKLLYNPDDCIDFNLILIGRAIDYLPYFIYAFDELGNNGIGRGRGRFILEEIVTQMDGEEHTVYSGETKKIYPTESLIIDLRKAIDNVLNDTDYPQDITSLTLKFVTPTRIKYQRRLTRDLEFHVLVRQLLRRIFLIWHFHCEGSGSLKELKDYHRRLINRAYDISIEKSSLYWYDWERYSHRQGTRMKLGGFLGEVTYKGDLNPFVPFLCAGETLHVGKGTTFGLGKYKIL
jgi:hypothetical protein